MYFNVLSFKLRHLSVYKVMTTAEEYFLPPIKVMTIGDLKSKKVKLLQALCKTVTSKSHENKTIFEGHHVTIATKGVGSAVLSLWDVTGQEEYTTLRRLQYRDMKLFLFCFAINDRQSFNNIKDYVSIETKYMYTCTINVCIITM